MQIFQIKNQSADFRPFIVSQGAKISKLCFSTSAFCFCQIVNDLTEAIETFSSCMDLKLTLEPTC